MKNHLRFLILFAIVAISASARADAQVSIRWFDYELPAGNVGSINIDLPNNGASISIDPATTFLRDLNGDGRPDYDGIRFVGKGIDVTNVRCTSWDGITLAVKRGKFKVGLNGLTLYSGYDRGSLFGEQNHDGDYRDGKLVWGTQRIDAPEFELVIEDVRAVVEKPPAYGAASAQVVAAGQGYKNGDVVAVVGGTGRATKLRLTVGDAVQPDGTSGLVRSAIVVPGENGTYTLAPLSPATVTGGSGQGLTVTLSWRRAKWMWFAYNADLRARRVRTEAGEAVEHAYYWHGFAKYGATLDDLYNEAGAECFKVRSDKSETAWAGPGTVIVARNVVSRNWCRDHTWRGGAAFVLQGSASHFLGERLISYAGPATGSISWNDRSHCVMVSSESNSYGHGGKDSPYGNGNIVLRQIACSGGSLFDWRNELVRVGRNSGSQFAARSLLMEESGLYGPKVIVSISDMPSGRVTIRGCNTPAVNAYCRDVLGMDTSIEATLPTSSRRVPISEGLVR